MAPLCTLIGVTAIHPRAPATITLRLTLGVLLAMLAASTASGDVAAATLRPDTLRAWDAYVGLTEARMTRELASTRGFLASDFGSDASGTRAAVRAGQVPVSDVPIVDATGDAFDVPSGTITHWRGHVFVPGVSLERLLDRAQHPSERGPFQPDVLALHVIERAPDRLRLFIKMMRKKFVTVTYNTEHDVVYRRHGSGRASSRSVATKIAELQATPEGERERTHADDHGFLWRLNAYWRFEQVDAGVIVELESLSLGRGIPVGLGLFARPIVERVARESMMRTLVAFREEQLRPAY